MKVAIYSPYLDTLGGGEKYMMTIAEVAVGSNTVDVLLDQNLVKLGADYLKNVLTERFALDLKKVNFIKAPIGKGGSIISRTLFLKRYDVLVYLTDGSIFYPTAKKNFLHIQSPLVGQPAKDSWGKIKLRGWNLIIYNSSFTQRYAEKYWPLESVIIYPPVDTLKIKPLEKKKYILSVGRFFGYLKDKKHADLIKTFKKLWSNFGIKDWSLHLAGSAGKGDQEYLDELKSLSAGLPINFYPNLDYDKLIKLYGQSSIYWHAAGFGETEPTKMEHFGISTVEAMAAECVPVVIEKGGQAEIVEHTKSGFLWESPEQLADYSLQLINDSKLRKDMANQAASRAKIFDKKVFWEKISQLIN